jgi:Fic family protein
VSFLELSAINNMADIGVFQPLFPEERVLGPLLEQAAELVSHCHRLSAYAGQPLALALAPRLRAMNSYYTNKIEGQHTRPADIERALANQYDADAKQARKQRLAVAHMDAEGELEARVAGLSRQTLYDPAFIGDIHAALYCRLPEADRVTDEGDETIVPGAWRTRQVAAGRHVAPPPEEVEGLLAAWSARYRAVPGLEQAVVGVACAHHRLLWIHPFRDGNGRAARLHSHLLFYAMGLTQGLWSPMRGLARRQEDYYARLNNADFARRHDYDGRGPLSQEDLVAFASFFLETCLDQAQFMAGKLDLSSLRDRIADLLTWLAAHSWQMGSEKSVVKTDALEAVHYVAMAGPVERARFMAMTGLPERTARRVLASLLDWGLLTSPSTRAPVSFAVPLASLRFLFPRLWPEAEADTG